MNIEIDALSSKTGQGDILSFIGLSASEMIAGEEVHLHKSA